MSNRLEKKYFLYIWDSIIFYHFLTCIILKVKKHDIFLDCEQTKEKAQNRVSSTETQIMKA